MQNSSGWWKVPHDFSAKKNRRKVLDRLRRSMGETELTRLRSGRFSIGRFELSKFGWRGWKKAESARPISCCSRPSFGVRGLCRTGIESHARNLPTIPADVALAREIGARARFQLGKRKRP